jgi:class 3 adenylate cyclase
MPDDLEKPSGQSLVRKLATILSADVAEFSRLMGEDEEGTLRTFRGHKQVFESLVTGHRGRIFNTAGDAILAEFASAVEAVRCATDIQAALRTRNDQLPPNRQVRFRIGINLGDVMLHGQDLLGDGVNVAARLQTAAEPGGICISGSVHDQITNKLSLSYQSLGEMTFKNIQMPVRTFSITHAQGLGDLPFRKPRGGGSIPAKWVAAGLVFLAAVAGAAYWRTRPVAPVEHPVAVAPAPAAQPEPTHPEPPPPSQSAAKPASPPPAQPTTITAATPRSPSTHPNSQKIANAAAAPSAINPGSFDGVYSGPICYGETRKLPERCYEAKGAISAGKISGQWNMGPKKKISAHLAGDVSKSGDVKIEIVQTEPDGRPATIDFKGTLHDGRITANGTFLMGRSAKLNWHKDAGASH